MNSKVTGWFPRLFPSGNGLFEETAFQSLDPDRGVSLRGQPFALGDDVTSFYMASQGSGMVEVTALLIKGAGADLAALPTEDSAQVFSAF